VRVHLGDLIHPGHSFFAYEDAGRQRPTAHPDVHGITRRPAEMARMIAELGNGRLEYSYQPQVPLLTMLLQLDRMASPRPSPACVSPALSGCRPRRGAGMEAAGLQELLPARAAIGPGNENRCQPGKECPMIIALLAILGVDLIVIAVLLAGVLGRRRWVRRQPEAFKGAIRVTSGRIHWLPARWHRGYGRWVRDILVWTPAPFLLRNILIPVDRVTGPVRPAEPGEVKRIGANPAIAAFTSDHSTIEIAAAAKNRQLLPGPRSAAGERLVPKDA
jgi:hypothetical protein